MLTAFYGNPRQVFLSLGSELLGAGRRNRKPNRHGRPYSRNGVGRRATASASSRATIQAAGEEARLPVICLHGLTRNSKDFEDIAPLIAGWGRRVIVPDVRGRGHSDRDPNPEQLPSRQSTPATSWR